MPRPKKDWKKMVRNSSGGGNAHISQEDLERLDDVIDLDGELEYKVSTGVSDGRARAFIQIRNRGDDG